HWRPYGVRFDLRDQLAELPRRLDVAPEEDHRVRRHVDDDAALQLRERLAGEADAEQLCSHQFSSVSFNFASSLSACSGVSASNCNERTLSSTSCSRPSKSESWRVGGRGVVRVSSTRSRSCRSSVERISRARSMIECGMPASFATWIP